MPTTQDKPVARRQAFIATPSELGSEAVKNLSGVLNALLADVFALYVKTKNFHWHMSGPYFRDYHPPGRITVRPDPNFLEGTMRLTPMSM
jgi:starvation-inducible DNA-binding protein